MKPMKFLLNTYRPDFYQVIHFPNIVFRSPDKYFFLAVLLTYIM